MTENTHHDPAALDKLAEPFTVLPNDNPASDEKRQSLIDKPAFGQVFSDNMTHMTWTKGEGWSDRRVEPYAPLKMDPGASVLHYAQECFEGLKAYRHADGSTWLFRPDANAERFQNSAKRLYLPELPIDDFLGSVAALVKRDANWVPSRREYTLYMRPFMFASEPFLGVRAPQEVDYCVIASPSGPYFPGGVKPVSIWVEDKWFRTGPGGTGFAKCGGNYAASLLGEYKGVENGCEQVCFVDAATKTYLEELGGMNMMAVHKDGHVETPSLTGNILPGVTRRSLIQLLQDKGHDVVETMIALDSCSRTSSPVRSPRCSLAAPQPSSPRSVASSPRSSMSPSPTAAPASSPANCVTSCSASSSAKSRTRATGCGRCAESLAD